MAVVCPFCCTAVTILGNFCRMSFDSPQITDEIVGIFPTPILISKGAIPEGLVIGLQDRFESEQANAKAGPALLSNTPMQSPRANDTYRATLKHIQPRLREYGEALMGESLAWAAKEIWINKMAEGGAQNMHNHANSFVSGVVYLTEVDSSAATVFYRPSTTNSFVLANENKRCTISEYNTPVFQMPPVEPGDMVLFPSYLLHEVPPNQSAEPRMTAAFNALPERLDSWGYTLQFR